MILLQLLAIWSSPHSLSSTGSTHRLPTPTECRQPIKTQQSEQYVCSLWETCSSGAEVPCRWQTLPPQLFQVRHQMPEHLAYGWKTNTNVHLIHQWIKLYLFLLISSFYLRLYYFPKWVVWGNSSHLELRRNSHQVLGNYLMKFKKCLLSEAPSCSWLRKCQVCAKHHGHLRIYTFRNL